MLERFTYPVDLSTDEAGYVVALFPDLPEAMTNGTHRAEALSEAANCLEEALAGRIRRGDDIPAPSAARGRPRVAPGALISAKAALHLVLREAGMSKVALARRLRCDEAVVRRMLDPRHKSKIERIEAALAVLGKRLVVGVHDAA